MNSLMPILKTPYSLGTHNSKASQVKPFLFRTTHGRANLGFILNGYGFISPEEIEQAEIPQLDMGFEYKWEFLKDRFGMYPSKTKHPENIVDNILVNLNTFQLIFAQSQKPIKKKELEIKVKETNKLQILNSSSNWLYTCGIYYSYHSPLEDYLEGVRIGSVKQTEYKQELLRKLQFEFKKRFMQSKLNPFESLELLTSSLTPNLVYSHDCIIKSHYGSIHELRANNSNSKPKTLSNVLIFR